MNAYNCGVKNSNICRFTSSPHSICLLMKEKIFGAVSVRSAIKQRTHTAQGLEGRKVRALGSSLWGTLVLVENQDGGTGWRSPGVNREMGDLGILKYYRVRDDRKL